MIQKRGDQEDGEWPGDSDYTSHAAFITGEVFQGYHGGTVNAPEIVPFPPPDHPGDTTSNYILFQSQVKQLAVRGLYGCTSVIVVSQRGAWASHIWESPTFLSGNDIFEIMGIGSILNGDGST